jgi:hypothetical protein
MGDLDENDRKTLRERLQKDGVERVKRRLARGGYPTNMEVEIENWLSETEVLMAKPEPDRVVNEGATLDAVPAEKSRDDAVGEERSDAANVAPAKKRRRRSANRKPTERPVTDWVVKAMIDMVKTDGPDVLNISVKNMRFRLQPANPNPKKLPSDEVISGARLEVLDRLNR